MIIKNQDEFRKLLRSKGIRYKDASKGFLYIRCPSCAADDQHKMKRYVHFNSVHSSCFICQEHMWLSDILKEKIEIDPNFQQEIVKEEHPQARVLPVKQIIPVNELSKNHPAIKFLEEDHFHNFDELWKNFHVCYIENGEGITFGKYILDPKESLLFPVQQNGILIGWQIRFIPGTVNGDKFISQGTKYLHVYSKSKFVYNLDMAKNSPYVVIVEGVKKAWKHPLAAIATLGKDISDAQLQIIKEHWKKVIFMMDSDGQKKVQEYMDILDIDNIQAIAIDPGKYGFKSPDEMTHEQMNSIVEENKKYLGL